MSIELWSSVDDYLAELFAPSDDVLEATLRSSDAAGLPTIQISANEGRFLALLTQLLGATRILEIGTLGGYSTIWLARALPDHGRVVTLEAEPLHAEVARENLDRAGLEERVDIRLGPAAQTLSELVAEGAAPFDLIFIDADKAGYPTYLSRSLALSRLGSLIVADNVIRRGNVIDAESRDPDIRGIREFLELCSTDRRLDTAVLQTVGVKGYDGMAFARVVG